MNKKTTTAIAPRKDTESLVPDAVNMAAIAKKLLDSGMWPQFKNEAQVFAAAEYGRELGIPPVMSLNTIFPVRGKLSMTADAMLAVAHKRASVTWKVDSSTIKGCTMTFMRPGFDPIKVTFDEADAKAAALLGKDNWINYPKAMYLSKAKSSGVRIVAPDSILGLYSIDEMEDIAPNIMPSAEDIIEVPGEVKSETVAEEAKRITKDVAAKPLAEQKKEAEKEALPTPVTEPKPTAKSTLPDPNLADKKLVVEKIKAMLAEKTFDPKHFKVFLYDFAKIHRVKFVERNQFKNLSFHEGNYNDLCKLVDKFEWLSKEYLKWAETNQPKPKESPNDAENGEPEEDNEPPF